MEYKRFTKRIGDFVTNHCKPSCPYWNVCEDDNCHCDKAALEILADIEDKIEQGKLKEIPEGSVVVETTVLESPEIINYRDVITKRVRKETAEKFAERVQELEGALLDMVVQFCQISDDDTLRHSFMSAEENAFDVLDISYGEKVADVYKRFEEKWTKPIDEICKELTGVE